jgi:hypothetical protein
MSAILKIVFFKSILFKNCTSDADCVAVSLFNFPFRIRIGFSLFH